MALNLANDWDSAIYSINYYMRSTLSKKNKHLKYLCNLMNYKWLFK